MSDPPNSAEWIKQKLRRQTPSVAFSPPFCRVQATLEDIGFVHSLCPSLTTVKHSTVTAASSHLLHVYCLHSTRGFVDYFHRHLVVLLLTKYPPLKLFPPICAPPAAYWYSICWCGRPHRRGNFCKMFHYDWWQDRRHGRYIRVSFISWKLHYFIFFKFHWTPHPHNFSSECPLKMCSPPFH